MKRTFLTAIISMAVLSACAAKERIIYHQTALPLPAAPSRPYVKDEELSCVPDYVYATLVRRDYLAAQYVETLETIIKSTHSVPK